MNPQWTLHERFIKITALLSRNSTYVEREAGIYALVSLADDWLAFHEGNIEQARKVQQSCLNMVCSQLRDPLPLDGSLPADLELLPFKHRVQRVLAEQFRPTSLEDMDWMPDWHHLELDLSYCHLHNLDFRGCNFGLPANFSDAHFHGTSFFDKVHFGAKATFTHAHFLSAGSFNEAHFHDLAKFENTRFAGGAMFIGTKFKDTAYFNKATIEALASFDDAEFHGYAAFNSVIFEDFPWFRETTFHATANFDSAEFNGAAKFEWTKFLGKASFDHVQFHRSGTFEGTEFVGTANFQGATFWQEVNFESSLCNEADFSEAHFHKEVHFPEHQFSAYTEFLGTRFCEGFHLHPGQGREATIDFSYGYTGVDEATMIKHLAGRIPSANLEGIDFNQPCGYSS